MKSESEKPNILWCENITTSLKAYLLNFFTKCPTYLIKFAQVFCGVDFFQIRWFSGWAGSAYRVMFLSKFWNEIDEKNYSYVVLIVSSCVNHVQIREMISFLLVLGCVYQDEKL